MGERTYRMTERARAVAATRRGIVDTAGALFAGEDFADVSLSDVAAAAGVARGTIYHQFGSRSGLLEAVTTVAEEDAGFDRLLAASELDDAGEALVQTVRELVRFYTEAGSLFENLMSLARTDEDARPMVERKEAARRDLFSGLVDRAAATGSLAVDDTTATAVILSLTCHHAVRELLAAAGSLERAADAAAWTTERLLR